MAALANLLPGVRDLRAPLAAGYIWLLGLWLAIEPGVPGKDEATGLLASLYRLGGELSTVGVGVVVSFVAYVVGSLSASLFSAPNTGLRRLSFISKRLKLEPFSAQARDALAALGRNTQAELKSILSMSETDVELLLNQSEVLGAPSAESQSKIWRLDAASPPPAPERHEGPGYAQPEDFDAVQQQRIARAVTRDLDTIATTRLLGKDQELFSAVDRLRAEMEFRRAIVPPIVFAAIVLVVRTNWLWWPLVIVVAAALCFGLLADSARLERRVNDLLLDVLAVGRVQSPTLERLRSRALAIGSQTSADPAEQAARRLAAEISHTIKRLEAVGTSEPTLAALAESDAASTRTLMRELEPRLPSLARVPAAEAVRLLANLATAWVIATKGGGFDVDGKELLDQAKQFYEDFLTSVKDEVAHLREQEAART